MPETQRCSRCRETKPVVDFNWRRMALGQRDSMCRPCRAAYKQEHYRANRRRYIDQASVRKNALADERTAYLIAFFKSHPCIDCGESDPVVLEFDHLGDKRFTIGAELNRRPWRVVLDEIAKC